MGKQLFLPEAEFGQNLADKMIIYRIQERVYVQNAEFSGMKDAAFCMSIQRNGITFKTFTTGSVLYCKQTIVIVEFEEFIGKIFRKDFEL